MNASPRLLVVGALHQDLVVRLTDAHRPAASNPARIETSTGGVAGNVARAIAAAGVPCRLIAPGEAADAGATLPGVEIVSVAVPGCPAGRYVAVLDAHGELVAGYADQSACETVDAEALLTAWPADTCDALIVDANLSAGALAGLVAAATAPIAAMAVSPAKALRLKPIARDIGLLFCNRREAAALTGLPENALLETLGDGLRTAGFCSWVLTDGPGGALVHEVGRTTLLAAPPVESGMNGVNGAGDALAGATLAELARRPERGLADAVRTRGLVAARRVLTG